MQLTDPVLSLRVARYNDELLVEPFVVEFGMQGGTIGRATDCTLVLPDQQHTISRVHARIEFRDGEYLLCDMGGNPSLLNQQAIGGTREARLVDGDWLQIGAYRLEVAVGGRSAETLGVSGLRDPLAAAKVLSGPLPGGGIGIAPFDPLGQSGFGQPTPVLTRPAFEGSQSDHVPPEFEAFAASAGALAQPVPTLSSSFSSAPSYQSAGGGGGIPADYDPLAQSDACAEQAMRLAGTPAGAEPATTSAPASMPQGSPTGLPSSLLDGTMTGGAATPFDDLFAPAQPEPLSSFEPPVQGESEPVLQSQPLPEWQSSILDVVSTPESRVNAGTSVFTSLSSSTYLSSTAVPALPATSTSPDEVLAALIAGLGLDPSRAPNLPPVEFACLTGAMLREALRGTMTVLRSRSTTKREARLNTTVIAAHDNNPLKFFPDVDSVLAQMLTGRSAGYLPPDKAIEQAFVDIESHELAVIAGMRAALLHALARFDPAVLDARLTERGAMKKLLSNRKAKLWDCFVEMQAQTAREGDDDFQKLFGNAFNDAYETHIDSLNAARRPGKPDSADRG
ncbi:type VI secretion system-associated FHA domain protein TagH [Burkholderia ubonensis]|uniref:type VI secretion system-associated FHA domain protein TagH n=1 Tax=Burkholderia ubonensis TaxID=101571 RepID=UPI00075DBBA1|nr:type VI secretion system-associated FHA domain protein TagH [Burkholderia ubonensis]KVQ17132.1 hypothetical protein WK00_29165 [Burkholderia ubonensis]